MALIHSNNDEENNLTAEAGSSYRSGAGATNSAATTDAPGASRTFDKIGSAAAEFGDDDETIVRRSDSAFEVNLADGDGGASPLSWLVPLVIMLLLIAAGYAFCSHPAS